MKKLFFFLPVIMLFVSCKKESGTVLYNINFTTNEINFKSACNDSNNVYTQFGDYITSLTPVKFKACIWTTGYIDAVFSHSNNNANMLQYIEQNADKLSLSDPSRIVDFSENELISFNPVIYGRVNNNNQFEDKQINFIYFYFMPKYFYQEVQLPVQYQSVLPAMFPDTSIADNFLRIKHIEMLRKAFPNAQINDCINLFFGNTDSTFVVNPNGESVSTSENNPISDATQNLIIRSDKYISMVYISPAEGETVQMNGVLSFNTQDLIQVYAGADNIPYTSDDVFVYAPNFWERIFARLDIN